MNFNQNKFFNYGMILIFLSGGITIFFSEYVILIIIGGIIAFIGFIAMLYGIRQVKAESENKSL